MASNVTISDDHLYRIQAHFGYPTITYEDFFSDLDQFKTLVIGPALEEYYSWLPITVDDSKTVQGPFNIPFPDEYTLGVLSAQVNTSGAVPSEKTSSPLINELLFTHSSGHSAYGQRYGYDFNIARRMERAVAVSEIAQRGGSSISVDYENQALVGRTNFYGRLIIRWAKWSPDFDKVRRRDLNDVIGLCGAFACEMIAVAAGMLNADTPAQLDPKVLEDRAEKLKDDIIEKKWKKMTKAVITRS